MDRQGGTAKKVHEYVRHGEYDEAIRIAERLNYDKLSNVMLAVDLATAYDAVGEKEDAKDVLLHFYKNKGGKNRNMMEFLIELCIVTGDIENGARFCMEYEKKWPEDPIALIMRYRIVAAAGGSLEEQARYLEEYKKADFDERWGYELAFLYYQMRQAEPCIELCHDMILYFGKGEYVERVAQMKNALVGLSSDEVETLRRYYPDMSYGTEESDSEEEEAVQTDVIASEEEEAWPETIQEEIEAAQSMHEFTSVTDEALQEEKSRYYVDEKLKQTEDKARQRKLKEQQAEEARLAKAEQEAQYREDMISATLHSDYYEQVEENRKKVRPRENFKPLVFTGLDFQATVNQMLSNFRESMMAESGDRDIEYITIGRNSESYAEAIEERIRSEITMLSEEQVRELSPAQVKELYELTVLHDVNGRIAGLVREAMATLPDVDMDIVNKDMDQFIREDALNRLVDEMNAREAARIQAEEDAKLAEEAARKQAEAEAEARARAANIAKMEEEARRKRAEAKIQEALKAQEEALKEVEEEPFDDVAEAVDEAAAEACAEPVAFAEEATEDEEIDNVIEEAFLEADLMDAGVIVFDETEDALVIEDVTAQAEEFSEATTDASETDAESGDVTATVEEENVEEEAAEEDVVEEDVVEEAVEELHTVLDDIKDPDGALSTDLFQACVVARAMTRGYTVDERAYMTIQILCDEMQEEKIRLSMNLAIALADAAIVRCSKGTGFGKLFKGFGKKNATVLKDRHFDWDDKMVESAGCFPKSDADKADVDPKADTNQDAGVEENEGE